MSVTDKTMTELAHAKFARPDWRFDSYTYHPEFVTAKLVFHYRYIVGREGYPYIEFTACELWAANDKAKSVVDLDVFTVQDIESIRLEAYGELELKLSKLDDAAKYGN